MSNPEFRAWSISNEGYVPADMLYIQADPIWGKNEFLDDMGGDEEFTVGDLILEQFTGMVDRKGTRIYDGDVVLVNDPSSGDIDGEEYRQLVVKYDVYSYYLANAESVTIEDIIDGNVLDAEVVGTIHDLDLEK